jgi:cytochrome b561
MACNCNKNNDDSTVQESINWKMILLVILVLALGWYFFLRSKGPDAFFETK